MQKNRGKNVKICKRENGIKPSPKFKAVLCTVVAIVILFGSMGSTLGDLLTHYGKGIAICYFFLYFWAIFYAFEKDPNIKLEREIESLKIEKIKLEEEKNYYFLEIQLLKNKLEELRKKG